MKGNLTAVEGSASVCQVNPASRITGGGRAERGGLGLVKRERGEGGGDWVGQLKMCVGTIKSFEGINLTVLEGMHQFINIQGIRMGAGIHRHPCSG